VRGERAKKKSMKIRQEIFNVKINVERKIICYINDDATYRLGSQPVSESEFTSQKEATNESLVIIPNQSALLI
jgi:hypothetical protein